MLALCLIQANPVALAPMPTWAPDGAPVSVGQGYGHRLATVALVVGGGVSAFLAHESGHLLANAILGNRPRFVPMWGFGLVPFFAISPEIDCTPRGCTHANGKIFASGRRGKFAIATAGFEAQHITSEIILSLDPALRLHRAPVAKGWLLFNIGLSLAYAVCSVAHIEDAHGDAGGAAALSGMSRLMMGAWLIAPALLDSHRYLYGPRGWTPWVSRSVKAGFVGLAFTF